MLKQCELQRLPLVRAKVARSGCGRVRYPQDWRRTDGVSLRVSASLKVSALNSGLDLVQLPVLKAWPNGHSDIPWQELFKPTQSAEVMFVQTDIVCQLLCAGFSPAMRVLHYSWCSVLIRDDYRGLRLSRPKELKSPSSWESQNKRILCKRHAHASFRHHLECSTIRSL